MHASNHINLVKGIIRSQLLSAVDSLGSELKAGRFRPEETIIVSGVPRGGTTWLMEILGTLPGYKTVFEPLNYKWFPEVARMELGARPYVPAGRRAPEVKEYLASLFAGGIVSANPHYPVAPNGIKRRILASRILAKFIRANRLLPWIANNFRVRKIYLILRHPCAVVESQLRTGIRGHYLSRDDELQRDVVLQHALQIPSVRNDKQLLEMLKSLSGRVETLAAVWCLDNYIPLSYPRPHPWHLVVYEELARKGEEVLEDIFGAIGEEVPSEAYARLRMPSSTTKKDESFIGNPDQSLEWKQVLSEDQIDRIVEIVRSFDLEVLGRTPEPDYGKLKDGGV